MPTQPQNHDEPASADSLLLDFESDSDLAGVGEVAVADYRHQADTGGQSEAYRNLVILLHDSEQRTLFVRFAHQRVCPFSMGALALFLR